MSHIGNYYDLYDDLVYEAACAAYVGHPYISMDSAEEIEDAEDEETGVLSEIINHCVIRIEIDQIKGRGIDPN